MITTVDLTACLAARVTLPAHGGLAVLLMEIPTTGYMWEVESLPANLHAQPDGDLENFIADVPFEGQQDLCNVVGTCILRFYAAGPVTGPLVLAHRQSWTRVAEGDDAKFAVIEIKARQ